MVSDTEEGGAKQAEPVEVNTLADLLNALGVKDYDETKKTFTVVGKKYRLNVRRLCQDMKPSFMLRSPSQASSISSMRGQIAIGQLDP